MYLTLFAFQFLSFLLRFGFNLFTNFPLYFLSCAACQVHRSLTLSVPDTSRNSKWRYLRHYSSVETSIDSVMLFSSVPCICFTQ